MALLLLQQSQMSSEEHVCPSPIHNRTARPATTAREMDGVPYQLLLRTELLILKVPSFSKKFVCIHEIENSWTFQKISAVVPFKTFQYLFT